MRSTVSVVVPTRDRASVLRRAVTSALAQTAPPLEVLVVNDASTDETSDAAAALAKEDATVRVLTLPAAGGAAAARNRGVAAARGHWIALLDDDDEWLPEKLAWQIEAAAGDPRVGLVHGEFEEVAPDGKRVRAGRVSAEPDRMRRLLVRGNRIGHSTVLVRRDLLLECDGYDERLPRLQDWDLWLRLVSRTRFGHVPRLVARVHVGPGTISADPARLEAAARLLVDKHVRAQIQSGLKPSERADLLLTLGRLLTRAGARDAAAPLLRRAATVWPWSARRLLAATLLGVAPAVFDTAERVVAGVTGGSE